MPTTKQVTDVLKTCYDPEIPVNVVDLGLIRKIEIKKDKVGIKMNLTSLFCPLAGMIVEEIKSKVGKIKGVKKAEVEIVQNPPWTPDRMSKSAKTKLGI
jgi:metal-sulfur cluster biosynthetic enzyme